MPREMAFPHGVRMSSSNFDFAIIFAWAYTILMLLYIPVLCYMDWKNREVPHDTWKLLIAFGCMSLIAGLLTGFYEWWMFVPSLVAIVTYFVAMKAHYIEGADWIYISLISLFFLYNPVTRMWFPIMAFTIFLAAMIGVTGFIIVEYNLLTKGIWSFDLEGGVPLMFPISAALILTVVLV